jgi:hypothetical protein
MGLIRKAASLSTLGGVKYTSRREAQTKAAHAQARAATAQAKAAREEAKLLKAQRKAGEAEHRVVDAEIAEQASDRSATPVAVTAKPTFKQMVQERRAKIQASRVSL